MAELHSQIKPENSCIPVYHNAMSMVHGPYIPAANSKKTTAMAHLEKI